MQFYPDMAGKGSQLVIIDVTPEGLKLNQDFIVDFGAEPDGPVLAHEVCVCGGGGVKLRVWGEPLLSRGAYMCDCGWCVLLAAAGALSWRRLLLRHLAVIPGCQPGRLCL